MENKCKTETAKNWTIDKFTSMLASAKSAPGGGSAAALQGSIGAGLIAMVCALTVNNQKDSKFLELNQDALEQSKIIQNQFLELIDNDMAEVMDFFGNVMKLPNKTNEDRQHRQTAMQEAFVRLATPPAKCINLCYEATKLLVKVYGKSYPYAQSDLECAAINLMSAAKCAWINVDVNLKYIKNKGYVLNTEKQLKAKISFITKNCSDISK